MIFFFVKKIRFISITDVVKNQILLALWAEFINTGFVIIIIYFKFFGFSFIEFFNMVINNELLKVVFLYTDFNRQSYFIMLSKLLLPFLLLVINPHTWEIFYAMSTACIRWLKNKFIKKMSTFIKNNEIEEFDLAYWFKNVMKLLMICFTFSSAMPILNYSILLGFFFIFWFHKKIFITYSGKSPSYSSKIILQLLQ